MNWEKSPKQTVNFVICLCVGLLNLGFSQSQEAWQKTWGQSASSEARKVYSDLSQEGGFWLITANALYHADSAHRSSLILHKQISQLYQDRKEPDIVYVAADDGIYKYHNTDLQRILSRRGCLSVIRVNGKLLAGTSRGLWVSEGAQNNWRSASGPLAQKPVSLLVSLGDVVYVTTPTALYRFDTNTQEYREIFSTGTTRQIEAQETPIDDEESLLTPELLDIDIKHDGAIYVSSRNGIYLSKNDGGNWQKLPDEGLPLRKLTALSLDREQKSFWAATTEGIYRFKDERWEKSDQGLETNMVYDLTMDDRGSIYAATNRGFFYLSARNVPSQGEQNENIQPMPQIFKAYADIHEYFKNEPDIREVQMMAIHYADVHPDKIKRWHRQSRLKAFVPSLSTGLDRSATDLMHWDTGSNPDTLLKGRDFIEWDVSLSWDLGDMVFSSDQTSIDSRSKLMVELREEVLDQVTRIYFERRRVQLTIMARHENNEIALDDELRLAELTAILDGFTGGQFTRRTVISGGLS